MNYLNQLIEENKLNQIGKLMNPNKKQKKKNFFLIILVLQLMMMEFKNKN